MKRKYILSIISYLILQITSLPEAGIRSGASLGIRWHVEHKEFTELPYDEGDLSYIAAFEFIDNKGYWQLALGYTPEPGKTNADYALTPQLNIILSGNVINAGIGILKTYISGEDEHSTDWYWQILLGFDLPFFGSNKISAMAAYPFDKWKNLGKFDIDDVDLMLFLRFIW